MLSLSRENNLPCLLNARLLRALLGGCSLFALAVFPSCLPAQLACVNVIVVVVADVFGQGGQGETG